MSPFHNLLEQSRISAAEPGWLGCDAHLQLLIDALPSLGVGDAEVSWAPAGGRTYWEESTRRMVLERPVSGSVPASDERLAEYTALALLHEALHARFSSASTLRQQVSSKHPWVQETSELMLNILEDARVASLAIAHDPGLEGPIGSLLDAAVDSLPASTGFSGPSTTPGDPRAQLPFAIMAYALRPNRPVQLHPLVSTELDKLRPIVDCARHAGDTDACVSPAIALVERVVHFQP